MESRLSYCDAVELGLMQDYDSPYSLNHERLRVYCSLFHTEISIAYSRDRINRSKYDDDDDDEDGYDDIKPASRHCPAIFHRGLPFAELALAVGWKLEPIYEFLLEAFLGKRYFDANGKPMFAGRISSDALRNLEHDNVYNTYLVGEALGKQDRYSECIAVMEPQLISARRVLGPLSASTLHSTFLLGSAYLGLGRYREAADTHALALEGRKALSEEEHPKVMIDVMASCCQLSEALEGTRQFARAELIYREELERWFMEQTAIIGTAQRVMEL